MKVTLVYPFAYEYGFRSFSSKSRETCMIHHGLCSIGAFLKNNGYNVDLIDLRKLKNWSDYEREIKKRGPDVVGITMNSPSYDVSIKCAKLAKVVNKKIVVVVGGIHPTVALNEVTENQNIDYIIIGEGEISFANLLENINKGIASDRVIRGIPPNLDDIPFIDRELFDYYQGELNSSENADILPPPLVTIITSRGCGFNCKFCMPAEKLLFGKKVRRRSIENVIRELKILQERYNFKSLWIHDDFFVEDHKWVLKFCDEYKKNGFNQPFFCTCRADTICKKEWLIKRLSEAGLKRVAIGFESGNQRILDFLNKGTTVEENYKAAEICKKYGIYVLGTFMVGIPTETVEEVMDTLKMISKIKTSLRGMFSPGMCFYTPYPGTYLYEYCKEKDLIMIKEHIDYRRDFISSNTAKLKGINYKLIKKLINKSFEKKALLKFYESKIVQHIVRIKVIRKLLDILWKVRILERIRDKMLY